MPSSSAIPPLQTTIQPTSPASAALPSSPLLSPNTVPKPGVIRYHDANLGKFLEWRAFQGWLWQAPHPVDSAKDYHGESVQAHSTVTVVAQFVGLEGTQRQAILDHVSIPSRAPALLRYAVEGDKLRVLQLFSIRGLTWLACVPLAGGNPGFIPLKATILHGNPPPTLPRLLSAPIHGSVRSYSATYRFVDSRGSWRVVKCVGVIQLYRISYHEAAAPVLPTMPRLPVKWLHFPYAQVVGLTRSPSNADIKLVLLDRAATREIHLHFASPLEAIHFYEDVEHMRRVTRYIRELQERRKREAELSRSLANQATTSASGQAGSTGPDSSQKGNDRRAGASPGAPGLSPDIADLIEGGLSPYLGAHSTLLDDGSQSPHLSQLGSPRIGPFF